MSRVEGFLPREVVVGGGGGGSRGGVRGRGRTALPGLTVGVLEVSIQSEKKRLERFTSSKWFIVYFTLWWTG